MARPAICGIGRHNIPHWPLLVDAGSPSGRTPRGVIFPTGARPLPFRLPAVRACRIRATCGLRGAPSDDAACFSAILRRSFFCILPAAAQHWRVGAVVDYPGLLRRHDAQHDQPIAVGEQADVIACTGGRRGARTRRQWPVGWTRRWSHKTKDWRSITRHSPPDCG